ncbi:RimJ/RimL family protein N-acetyltransferase [Idiomarina fontislapidosi]|uniref:GNAT family N-acetyltransferase n=1 Tax=Idiomarina fontislapidosi TaxID=263723 RepID=A0A432Y8E1_9GAMM|nr:GNAT family protein [Idiomarina fontislapidosi]PYE33855.1 RimJ/RimL family protein N-acetyltransferase [Idiomarina fontislapidosi]RUO57245.1 GNAT family N-acetyltransferase [Idiomarina fontislapidosi]|tara:strand:- start:8915 stop:9568 length:654 start_codon:yes stop_codon:yes gene_type:complete
MIVKRIATTIILAFFIAMSWSLSAVEFWQDDLSMAKTTESSRLKIEALKPSDAAEIYTSYMDSQPWLYEQLGWSWPSSKTSEEQNGSMIQHLLKQMKEKTAFSFVVIDKQSKQIVGMVYFAPVASDRASGAALDTSNFQAEITWWLGQDAVANSLHNDLFALTTDWLRSSWPWSQVLFPVSDSNHSALAVLENSAARKVATNRDTQEVFYSYTLARK